MTFQYVVTEDRVECFTEETKDLVVRLVRLDDDNVFPKIHPLIESPQRRQYWKNGETISLFLPFPNGRGKMEYRLSSTSVHGLYKDEEGATRGRETLIRDMKLYRRSYRQSLSEEGATRKTRSTGTSEFKFVVFQWAGERSHTYCALDSMRFFPEDKPQIESPDKRQRWQCGTKTVAYWAAEKSFRTIIVYGLARTLDEAIALERRVEAEMSEQSRKEKSFVLDKSSSWKKNQAAGESRSMSQVHRDSSPDGQYKSGLEGALSASQPASKRRRLFVGDSDEETNDVNTSHVRRVCSTPNAADRTTAQFAPTTPTTFSNVQQKLIDTVSSVDKIVATLPADNSDAVRMLLAVHTDLLKSIANTLTELRENFDGFVLNYQTEQATLRKAVTSSLRMYSKNKKEFTAAKSRPQSDLDDFEPGIILYEAADPPVTWMEKDMTAFVNDITKKHSATDFATSLAKEMWGDDLQYYMLKKSNKEKTSTGKLSRSALEDRDPTGVALVKRVLAKFYAFFVWPNQENGMRSTLISSSAADGVNGQALLPGISNDEAIPKEMQSISDPASLYTYMALYKKMRKAWTENEKKRINLAGNDLVKKIRSNGGVSPCPWSDSMFGQLVSNGYKPTPLYNTMKEEELRQKIRNNRN